MSDDITALAQRLKVYAEEFSYPVLSPDDCRALVEALEEAQQTEKTIKNRNRRLAGIISEAAHRIAELESRTVTVKLPKAISVLHRRDFIDAHRAIYAYPEAELNAALAAAGIQVIEGEE